MDDDKKFTISLMPDPNPNRRLHFSSFEEMIEYQHTENERIIHECCKNLELYLRAQFNLRTTGLTD